ncbi:hypothetical protein DVH24_039535 [Malus domestica]|uniref:Uncharacterized protein n=1 Tax=Malus domestica TaxID=3750 RepID=A0A498I5X5_MALDO|nr:hypothetical protein DVH24_039535 [Malus domestica]
MVKDDDGIGVVGVNAKDDTTNSEFVDSDYSLEDDDCRAVVDTVVESVIGDAERGEGVGNQHLEKVIDARDVENVPLDYEKQDSNGMHRVGNQHLEEVIDARDVENVPLDYEKQDSNGMHSVDDSSSECDKKIMYPEFNEEVDRDDPRFEKGIEVQRCCIVERGSVFSLH